TFVDVGANIGYYTLVAARIVGAAGAVYAFEPNAPIRERLERHIALNGLSNVVVSAEAVSAETGEIGFYASVNPENQGSSSLLPGEGLGAEQIVPAVALDDLVARHRRRFDLLKMDVEGAELQLFAGGKSLLASAHAPALLFESTHLAPALDLLRGHGYQVFRM